MCVEGVGVCVCVEGVGVYVGGGGERRLCIYTERVITVGIGWVLLASATSGCPPITALPRVQH